VILTAILDCPQCDVPFEGQWADDSIDPEQRDDAPVQIQACPNGHQFEAQYPGWSYLTEAG